MLRGSSCCPLELLRVSEAEPGKGALLEELEWGSWARAPVVWEDLSGPCSQGGPRILSDPGSLLG